MDKPVPEKVVIGIDVGSTTVKMTVVDPTTKEILWSKYLRHETRQPEMTREMLREIHAAFPTLKNDQIRTFITGSGGSPIAPHLGSKFVQEVNAVTMAVEKLHPDVGSVIELGGQFVVHGVANDAHGHERHFILSANLAHRPALHIHRQRGVRFTQRSLVLRVTDDLVHGEHGSDVHAGRLRGGPIEFQIDR